jgi:exopolysaccharide biosynthesis polyprenyl glycosylphosphotransferase
VRSFDKNLDWSKKIVGVATDDKEQLGHIVHGNKVVTTCDNLLDYVTHHNIDEIMSFYELSKCDEKLKTAFSKIEEMGIKINLKFTIEGFDYIPKSLIRFDRIANVQCVSISRNFISPRKILGKKILDFSGGLIGFLIFVIAYIIVAPIIKFDSKGPVLFSQLRVGRNGRIFKCYKFRSMYTDAEERKKELMAQNEMQGLMFKLESDPRITRVGKFIRRTSIDELPQFLNVLKGDMSLVGTRPPTLDEYQYYEPQHKARVSMNPGLTGLWQVSGRSDIKNFEDVVKLDMQYIDNWSIYLDIKIILLTIKVVLFGKGAK